jgi:GT2 family glycosyltransferase
MQEISAVDCSVIIITYNSSEVIEECIRRVFEKNKRRSFEIIVIDNHSKDGTAEKVRSAFPQSNVRVIKNNINIGFARAVNQGVRLARGKYILLLNPDAFLVSEEPIDEMIRFLGTHPKAAAVGGVLKGKNSSIMAGGGYQPLFTIKCFYLELLGTRLWNFLNKTFLKKATYLNDISRPYYARYLVGSFILASKKCLNEFPFLEKIFIMSEDLEWGDRINNAGWRLFYLPSVKYNHIGRYHLSKTGLRRTEIATRISVFQWFKTRSIFLAFIYRWYIISIRVPIYFFLSIAYFLCSKNLKAEGFFQEVVHLLKWRYPFPK